MTRFACLLSTLTLALAGCSSDSKPFQTTGASPAIELPPGVSLPPDGSRTEPTRQSDRPGARVELKVVEPALINAAVQEQKGKIVVLDLWATWCLPCKKEFPHLVELHKKRARDNVVCMSVAWDDVEDRGKALAFLTDKGAEFANFLIAKGEKPTDTWLDEQKVKSIPVVLVFGRDGKLVRKFDIDDPDKQFTYDDVNKLVDELIRK